MSVDLLEKPGLDSRIAVCFGPSATASFVAGLVREVDQALATAKMAAEQARSDALSPTLGSAAQRNAKGLWDDAEFHRDRLQAAAAKLRDRLAEVKADEENTRRRRDYDAAAAVRDKLAEELSEYYPQAAERLVALFSRLVLCDNELNAVNSRLPHGAARLERAEFQAKQLIGKPVNVSGVNLFTSVTDCRIQPWHPHSKDRWPR